ncbi:MAG: fasciclin domain-containing protein [Chloroflexi bacterium]|nr:fasciclin domain-containing protein [Chloroflexota bacterium]
MRKLIVVLVLALFAVPVFAQDAELPTIADIVVASTEAETPEFTVLLAAVAAADPAFLETLSNPDAGVTVFAPTDAAFGALLEALDMSAEDVLGNADLLNSVLAYHVVPGVFNAEAVVAADGAILGTFLAHQGLLVSVTDDGAFVNEATIVATDIAASNGIVHVIDAVLVPNMDDMMGDDMGEMMEEPTASIAETVVAASSAEAPEFTVLLAAVLAADPSILDTLINGGPYTVFAPTDAAFGALLEALGATAEEVLANTDLLNTVLAYHVVPGTFVAGDIVATAEAMGGDAETMTSGFSIATLLPGGLLEIGVNGGAVTINETVNVIATDVYATNGVIHVIDAVLVPAADEM